MGFHRHCRLAGFCREVFPGSGRFDLGVGGGKGKGRKRKIMNYELSSKDEKRKGGVNEKERLGIVTIEETVGAYLTY